MANRAATSALGTSPVLFPNWGNRSPRLDSGRVHDSEILHVNHAAHAAGSAIHLGYGHDGGDGGEGRRRTRSRGRRLTRGQEFGRAVYWRSEEPDITGPPHPTV